MWHGQSKRLAYTVMASLIECPICGCEYPPEATRWLCPECKYKDSCCEGEPRVKKMRPSIEQDKY